MFEANAGIGNAVLISSRREEIFIKHVHFCRLPEFKF